jgi:tRNA-dihydrouridine synthase B
MQIGPYALPSPVLMAPMAGVTDRPFRRLCRRLGAAYTVGEMATSDPRLWSSAKTARRLDHDGEPGPIAVQLAGADPLALAHAARASVAGGAQIIDINMGCPAKKVCNAWCGSALLRDEALVARILEAVVGAVDVPVTLKFRTGWDPQLRNAVAVARIAEAAGIRMLTLHGRTRACGYRGEAEYDTIAAVKRAVAIPVVANGDIDGGRKARAVLDRTGADAVMVGRAAHRRPWILRRIAHYLATGVDAAPPEIEELRPLLLEHLDEHYQFNGSAGVRTARKHILAFTRDLPGADAFFDRISTIETCDEQASMFDAFLRERAQEGAHWPDREGEVSPGKAPDGAGTVLH